MKRTYIQPSALVTEAEPQPVMTTASTTEDMEIPVINDDETYDPIDALSRKWPFLSLLFFLFTLPSLGQTIGDAFYIYRNDGQFNAFFRSEVDSIAYSNYDADSIHQDEIVTQLVYTADSLYRIPLAAIDSVGFVTQETIYKQDAVPLAGTLFDYLVSADSLSLTFASDIPSYLLPNIGDKLVATELSAKLPLGFTGQVRQVQSGDDGYVIICDSLALEETVTQFYGVIEMVGQQEGGNVRRYLQRRANSEQAYPFRLVIPSISQNLDLSPLVKSKDVYDISGKAVATTTISPVITGRITRVIDNRLNIDHYNIHSETDVTTVTTIEVVGEVTNSDNPLNLSSPKKNFSIEGTKPGPYGIPIYYAFGPKFEMSGELALGTTVYANFKHTEDINFYPLAAAIGVVAPGFTPVVNRINTVSASTNMTHFDIDWAYIAGRISARVAICGRLGIGIAVNGRNLGWVGAETQIGAKAEAELGFDFEALSKAENGTGFYDGLKERNKVVVMPYWGLEAKLSLLDDRIQFTFLGRDNYTFWDKKWEWDFLPIFSDTKAVPKGATANVSANIINDCLFPYTVGFSLFDDNNNRIGEPQWNEQKFWRRNNFTLPYEATFTDVATDKQYKVYPTLRFFGFNVLASPSADLDMEFPVTLSDFEVTDKQYKKGGFTHEGVDYDYRFDVTVTATLDDDAEDISDWGYAYLDPDGYEALISLKQFGRSKTDDRWAYFRKGTPPFTCTLYGYVKYVGSDEPVYGEPHDYPLEYSETFCPNDNHPHWIDLGLPSGTQWRCCNEGASTPEAYGGYYTFGQVSTAPTFAQINELLDNCSSVWTTLNGVNGRKFTGPNGGTIFLPAAGSSWGGELHDVGSFGLSWSSTPYVENYAYDLYFGPDGAGCSSYGYRSFGQSVRPVR